MRRKLLGSESPEVATSLDNLALVLREPIGVVGAISPWNFPLAIFLGQVAAAFAAGNAVIAKPANVSRKEELQALVDFMREFARRNG